MRATADVRFDAKVDKGGDCWEWTGGIVSGGYGSFWPTWRQSEQAHRWAYARENGPIPAGMEIDHLCRNRRCVRPPHLEAVTRREHAARSEKARRTVCKNGHAFDEANTYIRPNGTRDCRACIRSRVRSYRSRVLA